MSTPPSPRLFETGKFGVISMEASHVHVPASTAEPPVEPLSTDPRNVTYTALTQDPLALRLSDSIGAMWEQEMRIAPAISNDTELDTLPPHVTPVPTGTTQSRSLVDAPVMSKTAPTTMEHASCAAVNVTPSHAATTTRTVATTQANESAVRVIRDTLGGGLFVLPSDETAPRMLDTKYVVPPLGTVPLGSVVPRRRDTRAPRPPATVTFQQRDTTMWRNDALAVSFQAGISSLVTPEAIVTVSDSWGTDHTSRVAPAPALETPTEKHVVRDSVDTDNGMVVVPPSLDDAVPVKDVIHEPSPTETNPEDALETEPQPTDTMEHDTSVPADSTMDVDATPAVPFTESCVDATVNRTDNEPVEVVETSRDEPVQVVETTRDELKVVETSRDELVEVVETSPEANVLDSDDTTIAIEVETAVRVAPTGVLWDNPVNEVVPQTIVQPVEVAETIESVVTDSNESAADSENANPQNEDVAAPLSTRSATILESDTTTNKLDSGNARELIPDSVVEPSHDKADTRPTIVDKSVDDAESQYLGTAENVKGENVASQALTDDPVAPVAPTEVKDGGLNAPDSNGTAKELIAVDKAPDDAAIEVITAPIDHDVESRSRDASHPIASNGTHALEVEVVSNVGDAVTEVASMETTKDKTVDGATQSIENMIANSFNGGAAADQNGSFIGVETALRSSRLVKALHHVPGPPAMSYADMARKVSSEKAPLGGATTNASAKAVPTDVASKPVAKVAASSDDRTSRFVPSLGGVVRSEKRVGAVEKSNSRDKQKDSTSLSKSSKSVVVLISNQSFKREVTVKQDKLLSVLNAKGIPYSSIDGADPANKDERNNLFELSGLRGNYPQIFISDGAAISFWGDYDVFENSNDDGTLVSDLGVEVEHLKMTEQGPTATDCGGGEASTSGAGNAVVVLISNQSFKREVTVKQDKLLNVLDSKGIQYKSVDGADPANKDERNNMFELSGLRGNYPQIFISDGAATSFWGDYDRFETSNDDGTLAADLGIIVADVKAPEQAPKAPELAPDASQLRVVSPETTTPSLLVLVSRQSLSREVIANQERAFTILAAKGILYETVDGADPANKDVRNDLFEVSGIRAQYPQFFLVKDGTMEFWGDWNRFDLCNEDGSIEAAIRAGVADIGTVSSSKSKTDKAEATPSKSKAETSLAVMSDTKKSLSTDSSRAISAEEPKSKDRSSDSKEILSTENSQAISAEEPKSKSRSSKGKGVSSNITVAVNTLSSRVNNTEITIYGATSFVAKHSLDYLMEVSLSLPGTRTVTLAGRNKGKLDALQASLSQSMTALRSKMPKPSGSCTFDIFVADGDDATGLQAMAQRTKLVANFAGPFEKYGEYVVAACAKSGTDYVDITGEVHWAGSMRAKYSKHAEQSGARIISFCGFDSVPSDLAVYAAVVALRRSTRTNTEVESATCWHSSDGRPNGGTVQTVVDMPINFSRCFSQPVPFLLDDPLVLAHPATLADPNNQEMKNRLAKAEWLNQLPSFDSILSWGASASFFMAPVNAKIVHASSVALGYGPSFYYRERFLLLGIEKTKKVGVLSIIPAMFVQVGLLMGVAVLKAPFLGKFIANLFFPAGSGASEASCKSGFAEVYSEVTSAPAANGKVTKANCSIKFEGDPGNYVTAQCVIESSLSLVLEKDKLPPRSVDGFGTPAELLGQVLLNRLQKSSVRPVQVATNARKGVDRNETATFC